MPRRRQTEDTPLLRRAAFLGCIAVVSACLLANLRHIELFEKLELLTYDWRMRAAPDRAPDDITIVAVDERSLRELQQWPWPRRWHAELIDKLNNAGAKLIAFDVVMAGPSGGEPQAAADVPLEQWGESQSEDDRLLAQAIKRAGNVILAATLTVEQAQTQCDVTADVAAPEFPYHAFADAALAFGPTNIPRDPDNVVRGYWLSLKHQDKQYPTMATCVAAAAEGITTDELLARCRADSPVADTPARANQLLLWYAPPETAGGGYQIISYFDVLKGKVPADKIRDKVILVGGTAQVLQDLWQTPTVTTAPGADGLRTVQLLPGVVIQATAVAALRRGRHITVASPFAATLTTLAAALLVALSLTFLPPLAAGLAGPLPVSLGALLLGAGLFASRGVWSPVAVPVLAAWLTFTAGTSYRYMVEEAGKRRLRRAWQRRVSPEVLDLILRNPGLAHVQAREVVATVLFSDLRGYTTLSAGHSPQEVVELLNRYLTRMTAAIMRNGGTINKFLGDGIMAVFGDPVPQPDHALRAVRAALEMQQELAALRDESHDEAMKSLFMRVGVHTGAMMAGDIGSEHMLEYTLIGDTVNTASRLESLGKEFDTQIIISANTHALVSSEVRTRYLGEVTVRNRPEPIGVHELLSLA